MQENKLPYEWVSPGSISKYNRAVLEMKNLNKQLVAQGKEPIEITEERVKARYVQMNGLLMEVDEPVVEEEESQVRRGRPRKEENAE